MIIKISDLTCVPEIKGQNIKKRRWHVLVIYREDIKPHELEGTLPIQGYVWIG